MAEMMEVSDTNPDLSLPAEMTVNDADFLTVRVNERPARSPADLLMRSSSLLEHRARVASLDNRQFKIRVDPEIEGELILYLETGSCPLAFETLNLLTYTAYKNKMGALLDECQDIYLSQLVPMNCLESLMFAEGHGCETLAMASYALALENFEDISNTPQFCHVGKSQLLRLVIDPRLNVRSPEIIYTALNKWCDYDVNARFKDKEDISKRVSQASKQRVNMPVVNNIRTRHLSSDNTTIKRRRISSGSMNKPILKPIVCSVAKPKGTVVCVGGDDSDLKVIYINFSGNMGANTIKTYPIPNSEGFDEDTAFCYNFEYIYACGGSDKSDACARFDLETKMWLKQHKMFSMGRKHHMLCYMNERVYAMGGINLATERVFEYIDKYNVQGNKWNHAGKLQEQVRSAACVALGQDIFIFGGIRNDGTLNKTVQCYSPLNKETRIVGHIPTQGLINRAITDRNMIYIFSSDGDVLEFNPCSEEFKSLPPINKSLRGFGAIIQEGHIFIFGGKEGHGDDAEWSQTVQALDLSHLHLGWQMSSYLSEEMFVLSCCEALFDIG